MKIVIQCANRKDENAGRLLNSIGEKVIFVAHPEKCEKTIPNLKYCRPDDKIAKESGTWRGYLARYNQEGSNPNNLSIAGKLYRPLIYQTLMDKFGQKNLFILSAGWGLIRSDYLVPYYDITFSKQGKTGSRRLPSDKFQDFNHLEGCISSGECVYFFGGKDYLPLYYSLTRHLPNRKVIYYSIEDMQQVKGYEYYYYKGFTIWHYSCAQDFIDNKLPI